MPGNGGPARSARCVASRSNARASSGSGLGIVHHHDPGEPGRAVEHRVEAGEGDGPAAVHRNDDVDLRPPAECRTTRERGGQGTVPRVIATHMDRAAQQVAPVGAEHAEGTLQAGERRRGHDEAAMSGEQPAALPAIGIGGDQAESRAPWRAAPVSTGSASGLAGSQAQPCMPPSGAASTKPSTRRTARGAERTSQQRARLRGDDEALGAGSGPRQARRARAVPDRHRREQAGAGPAVPIAKRRPARGHTSQELARRAQQRWRTAPGRAAGRGAIAPIPAPAPRPRRRPAPIGRRPAQTRPRARRAGPRSRRGSARRAGHRTRGRPRRARDSGSRRPAEAGGRDPASAAALRDRWRRGPFRRHRVRGPRARWRGAPEARPRRAGCRAGPGAGRPAQPSD